MTPTLILTRPAAQSESFGAVIAQRWAGPLDIIISPIMQILPVEAHVPKVDAVIFTSVNGVHAAQSVGLPQGTLAWCVGPTTAKAATAAGFEAQVGPGDADGLVAQLLNSSSTGRLAHIRGRHARGDVAARLGQAGCDIIDIVAYDQRPCALSDQARAAMDGDKPVVIPLFSPRSCTILQAEGPFAAPTHVVAISMAVVDAIDRRLNWQVSVAKVPDGQAMQDATLTVLAGLCR